MSADIKNHFLEMSIENPEYMHIKYQHNFFSEYKIDKIINQFSDIFPFITVQEIFQKVPEIKNKILQETYQKLE